MEAEVYNCVAERQTNQSVFDGGLQGSTLIASVTYQPLRETYEQAA